MADRRLIPLCLLLAAAAALFLTVGARGDWAFVLSFRGQKLAALIVVGAAVATSTILFQTACGNRILTPSIMGFDALYVLLQTGLALGLGPMGFVALDPWLKFGIELSLLSAAAGGVFGALLGRGRADLHRMVLAGIVCGVLFHSLAAFGQRLMDPSAFSVVQAASFAQFNRVNADLLPVAGGMAALCIGAAWRMRHQLDVLALGRDLSINLGLDHGRVLRRALMLSGALVAISTALVGPVAFFGLLVTALAHLVMRTHRHAALLPAAALVACIALVGGQTLFERALGHAGTLSVAVEFLGGLVFLFLLLRRPAS